MLALDGLVRVAVVDGAVADVLAAVGVAAAVGVVVAGVVVVVVDDVALVVAVLDAEVAVGSAWGGLGVAEEAATCGLTIAGGFATEEAAGVIQNDELFGGVAGVAEAEEESWEAEKIFGCPPYTAASGGYVLVVEHMYTEDVSEACYEEVEGCR